MIVGFANSTLGYGLFILFQLTLGPTTYAQNQPQYKLLTPEPKPGPNEKLTYFLGFSAQKEPPSSLKVRLSDSNKIIEIRGSSKALETKQRIFSGGTHGGGGGGGMACSGANQYFVREYWEEKGSRLELEKYKGTPFYKWAAEGRSLYPTAKKNETPNQYLNRVLNRFNQSPHFLKLLKETIKLVLPEKNKIVPDLEIIDDWGEVRDFANGGREPFDGCVRIQLARRLYDPETGLYQIEYNGKYFEKLGDPLDPSSKVVNQALLILHEALYLIGNRLRTHTTSYLVHGLTNYLLIYRPNEEHNPSFLRSTLRTMAFDDYFIFENEPQADFIRDRQDSYYNLVLKLSQIADRHFEKGPFALHAPRGGRAQYLALPNIDKWNYASASKYTRFAATQDILSEIYPSLNHIEAFVLAANVLIEIYEYDFEGLFMNQTSNSQKAFSLVCAFGSGNFSLLPPAMDPKLVQHLKNLRETVERELNPLSGHIEFYCR